jgi:hypothetical protein
MTWPKKHRLPHWKPVRLPCTGYGSFPFWDGEAERFELGSDLQETVATIVRERSLGSLIGKHLKPMRVCMIEQEEALCLLPSQKTFYAR